MTIATQKDRGCWAGFLEFVVLDQFQLASHLNKDTFFEEFILESTITERC